MFENIRLAFQGIWSHKMRSFLTMLGIIIGIASIIAIVSTIKGTSEQIKEDLIGSGNNTVDIVLKEGDYEYDAEYGSMNGNQVPPLLTNEQKEKVRKLDHVKSATFYHSRSYTSSVYYKNTSFQGGKVFGIDESYLDTCDYIVQAGRGFGKNDYDSFAKVALVDTNAAANLFEGENPIGKTVEIGTEPFTVVGILTKREDDMPNIQTLSQYDEYHQEITGSIMIPNKSWPIAFKFDEPENVIIKADSTDNMSAAGKSAEEILNSGISASEESSGSTKIAYKADDVMERVKNLQKLSQSTNQQLIWIASISLLVGGIGVMNIMLVSVTERTSEIGLKKAIGARKKTILAQFLTEAAVLTSIGGIIGVISGIGLSRVVAKVSGAPTAISVPAIIASVVFSMLIGVIFGLLPSVKASNLNPIDALRSE